MISKPQKIYRPAPPEGSVKTRYLLVLLAAMVLYAATVQRGVCWQDSGMHQWRGLNFELTNPLGLALAHPLWIVLVQPLRIFGSGFAVATNLLSGLAMAVTVANLFLLGFWLTGRTRAALLAAGMFAVAHTPWWLATVAETYPLVSAGLSTELIILMWFMVKPGPWKLALLALVSGLGFSLHNFALLPLPVYVVTAGVFAARRRIAPAALALAGGAWLAGAGLQLSLIIQAGLAGGDWAWVIREALFGSQWQADVLNVGTGPGGVMQMPIVRGMMYLLLNWPFVSLVPVLYGWWAMPHHAGRGPGAALGAVAAVELLFGIRYPVEDQFMFLLPGYVLLAIGAAVGIDRILSLRRPWRVVLGWAVVASVLLTPVLYGLTPLALSRTGRSIRPGRSLPFRDENSYWLSPWKLGEGSAERFSIRALIRAEDDAVILAGPTEAYPLLLTQRLRGIGPSVEIVGSFDSAGPALEDVEDYRRWLADRPMYVIAAEPLRLPRALAGAAEVEPGEVIQRVNPQSAATSSAPAQ